MCHILGDVIWLKLQIATYSILTCFIIRLITVITNIIDGSINPVNDQKTFDGMLKYFNALTKNALVMSRKK
ncbi:hypothetical protein GCM10023149_37500 [Mucilaginibacter gynuensis]|uniref:Uncharacterized protein n=1 Tax=Mucilaginibacter gynuensis TaxID=1302236 RepID=A0ABP8GY06_9SPHI